MFHELGARFRLFLLLSVMRCLIFSSWSLLLNTALLILLSRDVTPHLNHTPLPPTLSKTVVQHDKLVTTCVSVVYGYLLVVPLVVWLASKYLLGIPSIGIVQLACLVSVLIGSTKLAHALMAAVVVYWLGLRRYSVLCLFLQNPSCHKILLRLPIASIINVC